MVADRIGKLNSSTRFATGIFLRVLPAPNLDYALDVCEAVMDVWQPTPENKTIINLPATVEMSTPEYLCRPDRMDASQFFAPGKHDFVITSA